MQQQHGHHDIMNNAVIQFTVPFCCGQSSSTQHLTRGFFSCVRHQWLLWTLLDVSSLEASGFWKSPKLLLTGLEHMTNIDVLELQVTLNLGVLVASHIDGMKCSSKKALIPFS